MTTRADYHSETAAQLLAKAGGYLAEDDLPQASDQGWAAAAQMVEAVAEARGWPHSGQQQLWHAVNRVVEETEDRELWHGFGIATLLHVNFYDDLMPCATVEWCLSRVGEFVGRLEELAG